MITTRDWAMISGFLAVMAFLWSISASIADMRQQIGENTAATSANTAAISDVRTAISEMRVEISGLREQVGANTAAIAELRGALFAHTGGHSHAARVAAADNKTE